MQIPSAFGKLDAWMIKPPNFDPAKRYPVVMYVYGGPAAPTTDNRWGGVTYLYHQALAQRGFIVFSVDGPGSQIDRATAARRLYHHLGPTSLAGQLAGLSYLRSQPFVDSHRIGLWGWSFGGYETVYALTHAAGRWKVGIAVAPVTDFRNYDSIYTERYLGLPAENSKVYDDAAVLPSAGRLKGHLLLVHGTGDDNVHMENTIQFVQKLIDADLPYDLQLYPRKTHSIAGPEARTHLYSRILEHFEMYLKPAPGANEIRAAAQ